MMYMSTYFHSYQEKVGAAKDNITQPFPGVTAV